MLKHHHRLIALGLLVAAATVFSCDSSCRGCQGGGCAESCEECIDRCSEEQGVDPELCRYQGCSHVCNPPQQ
jgi:hypothetical protein